MATVRSTTGALLTIFALLLSACSGTATPSQTSPGGSIGGGAGRAGSAPVGSPSKIEASGSIYAFGVSYKTGDTMAKGRIDLFNESYPNVKVTYSESGFDPQKFLAALQSNDKPDVVRIPRDRIGSYVTRGVLEPLDDCISRTGTDLSNFREAAVKQVTIDGKVYAMPEFFWVSNWLIDNDLFEQAGIDPANWDVSNWDQIKAANDSLISKTKTKVAIDPKVWDNGDRFPMWVAAAGGQMLSDDGKESKLDSPQVADALNFTKSLIDAQGGVVRFKDAIGQTGDFFAGDEFKKDLEAAFPMQQWYLNVLAGAVPTTKITAKPFMTKAGQPMTYEEGDGLAVLANSDNKDAACAFVTTMVSTDAWAAAAKQRQQQAVAEKKIQTGSATGNKTADDQIFSSIVDVGDNQTFRDAIDANMKTFDTSFGMPPSPAAEEFRTAWIDAVNKVLSGAADAQSALAEADQTAQDAIDQAAP
jgi:multiple sugar transport system substrate-binding protein